MKLAKPTRFYTWCFVLSMPFIAFALCYIMYKDRMFREWHLWLYGYILVYTIGYFSWRLHFQYDYFLQTKFPGIEHTRKRIAYKLLINVLVMSPSVSLQLLVENAVKHNVVSKHTPLSIEIFTTEGKQLVVNNNLNRKIQKEKSTRIGLQNIESKYKLMNMDGFQVVDGEKNFMVVLPMIWKPKK